MKLRICHFPQIQCNPFIVEVKDVLEAKKIADTLAFYDLFQYENKIKPDYCNAVFLECWDDEKQDWFGWYDEETGADFDEYCIALEEQQ